jgi:alpha-mannosidase
MANEDAWAIYDARSTETEALIQQALTALLSPSDTENAQNEGQIYVIDPMRLNRRQVVQTPPSNAQGVSSYILIETDESGLGQSITNPSSLTPPHVTVTGNQAVLENSDFRLEIKDGRLKSLVDLKLQRELISPGPGASDAGLMLYDDFPLAYDAWDAEIYHLDQCRPLSFTKVEIESQDRLRASVKATAQFGMSSISLIVRLAD